MAVRYVPVVPHAARPDTLGRAGAMSVERGL